ncbi:SDR family NAD(P)-dependent oxidoreductase [Metabacillus sp. SLBN-84]
MKYTVITGASSGIGYEAALAFARRGKHLIVAARREDQLLELKNQIHKINPELETVIRPVDLSVPEHARSFYDSLKEYDLETWVNNAGFGNFASVGEQNLEKIETMLQLNIQALTILSTLFARDYSSSEGAQLLNISSAGGYTIVEGAVTYCATKFYVSAFTEGMAQELKGKGAKMQAKVLAPAATETEFAKRSMDLEDFSYSQSMRKFHTAQEMAQFLLDLYDSSKTVGIVDGESYEFTLRDPIFSYAQRKQND